MEHLSRLDTTTLGIFAAAALMAIAVLVTAGQRLALKFRKWRRRVSSNPNLALERDMRLDDIVEAKERQDFIARWSRRVNWFLTFSQFIVGGVLASSFVQKQLDADAVGSLGLLVLISTLMFRHYRPDLVYRGARRRALRLSQLQNWVEDQLFEIKRLGAEEVSTVQATRREVTARLGEVMSSEFDELEGETTLLESRNIPLSPRGSTAGAAVPASAAHPASASSNE